MKTTISPLLALLLTTAVLAQPKSFNYDEAKVPKFDLPDPLLAHSGKRIKSSKEWTDIRRHEVLELFRTYVYGRSPGRPSKLRFVVASTKSDVLDGLAHRSEIDVLFDGTPDGPKVRVLLYVPARAKGPVPAFVGLNFRGNHTVDPDPTITIADYWSRGKKTKPKESTRGASASRWAIKSLMKRNFALATAYYGDIDPDFDDGFKNGVHPLFYRPGQTHPDNDEWGSIAAWAWGLSRMLDLLETDKRIDAKKVAVMGHSRLGKTALWAGAEDARFAIVISNNSGCGGAALSRRRFGETVARINTSFPHWFCDNFNRYNDKEFNLPVDQHMLVALAAPRPVYIASAVEDRWADPNGEFLSALHAQPVYALFGKKGLGVSKQPDLESPAVGQLGYHIRSGKHDVTEYDWQRYMDFADLHYGKK